MTCLFDTRATCSYLNKYSLNFGQIKMIKKPLKVNTAGGATLGPIGIALIEVSIDDHNFVHNFIVCTQLKKHLILGLDFTQRYRIGIDWDIMQIVFEM